MEPDVLDQMPPESRNWVVTQVQGSLGIPQDAAEAIVRAAEPFWNAMEDAGGLVDSWGGGEFCGLLPRVLEFIKSG